MGPSEVAVTACEASSFSSFVGTSRAERLWDELLPFEENFLNIDIGIALGKRGGGC